LKLQLRKYQKEALNKALKEIEGYGRKGVVLSLPTGTGKTVIGIAFSEYFLRKGVSRVLVLEPTIYLVNQVGKKFSEELSGEGFTVSYVYGGVSSCNDERWLSNVVVSTLKLLYHLLRSV